MSRRTRRAIAPDSQLRNLSDDDLRDFLARARSRLGEAAHARAGTPAHPPPDAQAFLSALAALELEATRRGLERSGRGEPHEPMPAGEVLRRLGLLTPTDFADEWNRLLGELDLPGLWRVYLYAQERLGPQERLPALAYLAAAVDRVVYGDHVARLRWLKHVELPASDEARLARLNAALEATFGQIFDRLAGPDPES